MKRITTGIFYPVSDGIVSLSIAIGEGQLGQSRVSLEGRELKIGAIKRLPIGSGRDLLGLTLTVKSVITDISDKTDRTSITYRMWGGLLDLEFAQQATVDREGDSVIYRLYVDFE
jgi:hypothetical protein